MNYDAILTEPDFPYPVNPDGSLDHEAMWAEARVADWEAAQDARYDAGDCGC